MGGKRCEHFSMARSSVCCLFFSRMAGSIGGQAAVFPNKRRTRGRSHMTDLEAEVIEESEACPQCDGEGVIADDDGDELPCPLCWGTGR